ncbi:MAG: hypothetical protein NTY35_10010 [Planctomycetota bacterium]|nr:hypothetical protein [Planctomycetota bacterium]
MIRLLLLVLAFLAVPPLVLGAEPRTSMQAGAFFAVQVLGPGWILASLLVPMRSDRVERLSLALVLGLAAQALAFLGAKIAGLDRAIVAYPLAYLPLVPAVLRAERARIDTGMRLGKPAGAALLFVLVLCVARTPFLTPDQWWARQDADLLFHLGNAAEFARQWPMQDPRVADTPLVYHILSYSLPASAHALLGTPVAELASLHYAGVGPLVLGLATFAAARALGGNAWAGVVAAGLVVTHTDLMSGLRDAFGVEIPGLLFQNHFDAGVFHSPTTRAGLAALAALVVLGIAWFRGEGPRWKLAIAIGLVAAFASGSKGSVLPIVVAGLGFAILVETLRSRRIPVEALGFLAVVLLGGAPFTLWLVGAESSYAGSMFRVAPMMAMRIAGPFVSCANALGYGALLAPWWLVAVCAPLWWILHAGAALVGACAGLGRRAPALDLVSTWLFGTAIAGIAAASILAAAGLSELFFAYNGHLALTILAGVAVVRAVHAHRRLALAAFLVFALPLSALGLARTLASLRETASAEPELARGYRAGLDWIREESPPDAVFVTSGAWTNVSAFGERRAFVESERFTPAWHAARWQSVNGRWVRLRPAESEPSARLATREALQAEVTRENVARARTWVPSAPLYLVSDRLAGTADAGGGCAVGPVPDQARLRENPLLEPVFGNASLAIYRVR